MEARVPPRSRRVQDVARLAALAPARLGELIASLPALDALAAAYPRAERVLLCAPWQAVFLAGRAVGVDRVLVLPRTPRAPFATDEEDLASVPDGEEGAEELDRFAAERFDLAVGLGRGAPRDVLAELDARLTVGVASQEGPALDVELPFDRYQHDGLCALQVVSLVGARPRDLAPRLPVLPRDVAEADARLPRDARPLVVLNPYTRDPRRRWPVDKFAEVGDALAQAGARVVVHGHDRERELTSAVLRAMSMPAEHTAGLSLAGLAGLFARASLVVANDSGPLHLATAVGAPAVGVYWCVGALTSTPTTAGPHAWHVSWRVQCILCGRNVMSGACPHRHSLVADVSAEEVTASALEMLARARTTPGESATWTRGHS